MKKGLRNIFLGVSLVCFALMIFACGETTYTVTFESNGGTKVQPIEKIKDGDTISLPNDPTRADHIFAGWYFDDQTFKEEFTETTAVNGDITVYAKWDIKEHVHNLVHNEAVPATCFDKGTIEYYSCTSCNKMFSDEEGKNEVTDLESPVLEHTIIHHEAVPATCTSKGKIEHYSCSSCGQKFSDENGTLEINKVDTPTVPHTVVHHEAVPATCTSDGTIEYYSCSVCHKNFENPFGTTEVTNLVIPALSHNFVFTETVDPDPVAETDGYDLYTCQNDPSHTERRNVIAWENVATTEFTITYVFDFGGWVTRKAQTREEVVEALFRDYYEWAVKYNNYKGTYQAFCKGSDGKYKTGYWYVSINDRMRDSTSKQVDESGKNSFFWNTPEYYYKWAPFFEAFDAAMKKVNSGQSFYTDTYAAMIRMHQFADWDADGAKHFTAALTSFYNATQIPQTPVTKYFMGTEVVLIDLVDESGRKFLGWYDNASFAGTKITSLPATSFGHKTFFAKWDVVVIADGIVVSNPITELERYDTHQLNWSFSPSNTTDQRVEFISSDPSVLKVNSTGLLTALKNGEAKITIKAIGGSKKVKEMVITVFSPEHFELSYDTASYVLIDDTINLNASFFRKDNSLGTLQWESLNPEIATVDSTGKVRGVSSGTAYIRVMADDNDAFYKDFAVTVISETVSEAVAEILASHQSNVLIKFDFGVGSGTPAYYADIYGSVNNLLFEDFVKNTSLLATGTNQVNDHGAEMTSIDFITVHYTGSMGVGSNAWANASYFVNHSDSLSIHYTVGNDGVYHCLEDKYGAYHAGDGSRSVEWLPTGVDYTGTDLVRDLLNIKVTASNDAYFEINGVKTSIKIPATYDYEKRGTAHVINNNGTITTNMVNGSSRTAPIEDFFTDSGFRFKVVDGKYYMDKTWWCYTQVYEGRICSVGGNRNSIGIESCVDKGSDLWYTWQKLAQLVANLLVDHNLDLSRVVMHNFFTAKDCHQPFLANKMELWYVFMDMVEHEYNLLTKFDGYTFTLSSDSTYVSDNGRVKASEDAQILTYKVSIKNALGETEEITLSSAVNGIYSR